MPKQFTGGRAIASGTNEAALVIPQGKLNEHAVVRRLRATCPNAAGVIHVCLAKNALETTVKGALLADATAVVLNGDDDGFIKGYEIQAGDYLLISTDNSINANGEPTGWRLVSIASATADAGDDDVDLVVAGLDGLTGVEAPVADGAKAFVVRQDQILIFPVGAATIEKEDVASSAPGKPIAFKITPGASGAHDFGAFIEYVHTQ